MAAEIAVHPDKPVVSFEPQHSNDKASTGDTSNTLNVALESSMKIWQVTVSTLCNITTLHCIILQPSGSRVVGGLFSHVHSNSLETTPSHLSAALDYSWMDFPKPNTGYKQGKREYYPRGKTLSQTTIPLAKYLSFSYQVFLWFFFVQVLMSAVFLVVPEVPLTVPPRHPVAATLAPVSSLSRNVPALRCL